MARNEKTSQCPRSGKTRRKARITLIFQREFSMQFGHTVRQHLAEPSINCPGEITSDVSRRRQDGGFLGLLRAVSLIAVVVGAVGSVGLMLSAGRSTPRFLLVLFVIWVLSPFVALAWANVVSRRWSSLTRVTLY